MKRASLSQRDEEADGNTELKCQEQANPVAK
jgi:hypothetical protein